MNYKMNKADQQKVLFRCEIPEIEQHIYLVDSKYIVIIANESVDYDNRVYNKVHKVGMLIQYGLFLKLQTYSIIVPLILMDISNQFIERLFSHPHFRSSFHTLCNTFDPQIHHKTSDPEITQIQSVADDISQLLQSNFKNALEQQCGHLYQSNRCVLEQLEQLKAQLKHPHTLKTQSSTAERDTNPKLQTSIFFQTDSQYDMKEIRKQFDDSIENKILTNSFEIDQQDKTYQQIEDKINASLEDSINRIELTLQEKFQKYSAKIEQIIQQLRKTIASVVEAMNEKDSWAQESRKTNNNHKNQPIFNAFIKKQPKPNQKILQASFIDKKDLIKQHELPMGNLQKHKQIQKSLPNAHSNSNKTIESLNKSINLGRTKIKSLFGFNSTNTKDNNQHEKI